MAAKSKIATGAARVRVALGRAATALRSPDTDPDAGLAGVEADPERDQLRERLQRLEQVVEGLQDAVHRETVRQDERIEALERKTEPAEMARALSDDARRRGL